MKSENKFYVAVAVMLATAMALLLSPVGAVHAQKVSDTKYALGGNGMLKVSPADLGVNALTEPGSSTSALSSIIDLTGATSLTLKFSCTQGNITLNVQTYAEDGTTTLALIPVLSAVPAATNTDFYATISNDIQSSGGTLGTKFRLPQKAIAFSFTNASATPGTCTARMFTEY
jgi:hypothetical protein